MTYYAQLAPLPVEVWGGLAICYTSTYIGNAGKRLADDVNLLVKTKVPSI